MGSKKDILVLEEHCCLKKIIFDQGVGWLLLKVKMGEMIGSKMVEKHTLELGLNVKQKTV